MQGGGHSPANHAFGLGADQVLETQVVLANGKIVIANACQNLDLFFAVRGGGPSTYGVVVSTTIKAHSSTSVTAQTLAIAPYAMKDTPDFMEAVAIMYESYPDLQDGGYSGYGSWSVASPTPIFANFTIGFVHAIAVFGQGLDDAAALFAPVLARLQEYNSSLVISTEYFSFPSYSSYYNTLSGAQSAVGASAALGSRFLTREALTGNGTALRQMLSTTAGDASEYTLNNACIVGGGQVFADADDPNSGVNPAWRTAYIHNIVARGWAPDANMSIIDAIHDDITYKKTRAMKDITPGGGCYMNEVHIACIPH